MSKATITSPLSIKRELKLNERDRLEFHVLTVRPIRNSMLALYGVAKSGEKTATKDQMRKVARRSLSQRWKPETGKL
ncbi:MAG: hypothetical protein ABJC04_01855 [Verrucomicrobiota bacterium]